MTKSANLGFPRIGLHRELKKALEAYWKGEIDAAALHTTARELRARHWQLQRDAGVDIIPSNDFSFYDHMLDTSILLGAIPPRFAGVADADQLYFAMARGTKDAPAMEMTKWFDTNYHFIVPELHDGQSFALNADKPLSQYREAKGLGIDTRPVVVGPVTFLSLAKARHEHLDTLDLLDRLLPVYADLLGQLAAAGAGWVQIDEPVLVLDLGDKQKAAFTRTYDVLGKAGPKLLLTTYFGALRDNTELAAKLPVAGLHIDLVRAPEQLDAVLASLPADKTLSVGVVDGRNIWRTDLDKAFGLVNRAWDKVGKDRLEIAPSCSLLHTPVDLDGETGLDAELKSWLAFSRQKLVEVAALTAAMQSGRSAARAAFDASAAAVAAHTLGAAANDADAMNGLAAMYQIGAGTNRNMDQALYWYERSAKEGNTYAMFNLGVLYENGTGVPKNLDTARYWLQKAVSAGDSAAEPELAKLPAVTPASGATGNGAADAKAGAVAPTTPAPSGTAPAPDTGHGTSHDKSAVSGGDHSAGTPSPVAAPSSTRPAAAGAAQNAGDLANACANDYDEAKYAEALPICEKAVSQGDPQSMEHLSDMYAKGLGVAVDPGKAFSLAKQAAALADPFAMEEVGRYYANGIGVAKDLSLAKQWLQKAGSGDSDAKTELQTLDATGALDPAGIPML